MLATTSPAEDPFSHVFLKPGSLYCATTPAIVTTLLGSCVAVCLWDKKHCAGGINHFVLPLNPPGEIDARYGDTAIDRLVEKMAALGSVREDLEAKVFGGAEVLSFGAPGNNVGKKNVEMALARLKDHAIPIAARRTGGERGLLVRFSTKTSHVLVRAILP